jgi:Protein of unknown function (DUF1559)
MLPPSIQFDPGQDAATSDILRPNWIIRLLPFVEQQNLYDKFDLTKPISDSANRSARGTFISTFICPSDPGNNDGPFAGNSAAEGDNWARGNYAANGCNNFVGVVPNTGTAPFFGWGDERRKGVMGCNVALSLAQITDGQSNTILLGEIRIGMNSIDRRGTWALGTAGGSALFAHGFGGDANGPNVGNDRSDDVEGCSIFYPTYGQKRLMQERMTCWLPCPSWQATLRSKHDNGVFVALGDGSVRYISNNVETSGEFGSSVALWDHLITSADGVAFPLP